MKPLVVDSDLELYHGHALDVLAQLPNGYAGAIVTSPPYLDARPEYPSPNLTDWELIFRELRRVTTGPALVNVGRLWRDGVESLWWTELIRFARLAGFPHRDTLVWAKENANPIQGRVLTSSHEYVLLLGDPYDTDAARTPYAEGSVERLRRRWIRSLSVKGDNAGRNGPQRERRRGERREPNELGARPSSVFVCPTGREKGNPHPAPMPLELAAHLVTLAGADRILDPFAGSGTTGIACRQSGRHAILVELDAGYANLAAERLAQQSLLAEVER